MNERLVTTINKKHPKALEQLVDIWYEGYYKTRNTHYHNSRYNFLNLHSFFTGNHTVELWGFNSELHAGKVRSYIVFALALNHQALTQKCASNKKPQVENEKFAMRTYLNRIGLIGCEFKSCREHLTQALSIRLLISKAMTQGKRSLRTNTTCRPKNWRSLNAKKGKRQANQDRDLYNKPERQRRRNNRVRRRPIQHHDQQGSRL